MPRYSNETTVEEKSAWQYMHCCAHLEYTNASHVAPTRSHDLLMNDYATICPGTAAIAIY